jgi:Fe2+ transport system protein FeoA
MADNKISALQLPPHTEGIIIEVKDEGLYRKLLSMGLTIGLPISIIRKTAMAKSYYVQIGNSLLAVRKNELDSITVNV